MKTRPKNLSNFYEGICPECQTFQCCPNPERGLEARLTCCQCQNVFRAHDPRLSNSVDSRAPTGEELLAVAEKYQHTMPQLAAMAVQQLERMSKPNWTEEEW